MQIECTRNACQQAELLEKHWRPYPLVLNRRALHAVRIEAARVRVQPRQQPKAERVPMYYSEPGVSVDE